MGNKYARFAMVCFWIEGGHFLLVGYLLRFLFSHFQESAKMDMLMVGYAAIFGFVLPLMMSVFGWKGYRCYTKDNTCGGKTESLLALIFGVIILSLYSLAFYVLTFHGFSVN